MTYNKFTILIPTRERCETLRHTIRTCLNQSYENYEIIVSDNLSQDNTKEVVMSFVDSRIKYVNTGKRLSMRGNFEFALSQVTDGYVMFLGDDDGILPNSLNYVNEIINTTGCEAVTSLNALYTWPGTAKPNQLVWSPRSGYEIRDSRDWLHKYLQFKMLYTFDLPGAYCGFVKRSAITKMTSGKEFFKSGIPDSYSAQAIAFGIDKYVFSYTPFAIHGSSSRSNGGSYLSSGKQKEGEEIKTFFKENDVAMHPAVVMTKSFRICSAESFLQLKDTFPELTKGYEVDWKRLLTYTMTEVTDATREDIESAVMKMCELHNLRFEDIKNNIPGKFTDTSLTEIAFRGINKIKNTIRPKTAYVADATNYGVYNIHDAVLLLKFFIESEK